MTQAEELRLHNLFIKFKNDGKSLDEIKMLLEVEEELVSKWNRGFEEALLKMQKKLDSEFRIITVAGCLSNGKYKFNSTLSADFDDLQKARFQLNHFAYANVEIEDFKGIQSRAKKYLPILDYFEKLKIQNDGGSYISEFTLSTDNIEIMDLAKEALEFYTTYFYKDISVQNFTQDTYQNAKNILPYCLKSLRCKAFDGIKETGFEGLPLDTNWIFLIGENGYGKTTLLRAIALGLLGEKEKIVSDTPILAMVREFSDTEKIEVTQLNVEYFSESQSFINNAWKSFQPLKHLACYGPSRLQIQTDQTKNDVAKKSTVTYSLFNSDGILLNIEFEMLIWFLEKNPRFEAVKQTILRLIPYLADIEVNVTKRMIYYIEKEPIEEGVRYNPVTFDQLASGFRSILAMVGDMMIRLFKSQPDITEPHELAGIVLIDELDLHWHPKMQREIPSLLTTIFPKVQFIASTHSLVPLLGAPENSVLLKVHRTAEEGVTVEQLTVDFQALSSDVLLRDIFELEKYMSDEKIAAWERYKVLQRRIRGEEDKTKQEVYVDERRELAIKYNFPS